MTEIRTIDQMAVDAVEKYMAEYEAAQQAKMPTPEAQAAQRLHVAAFRERVTEECLLHGVHPKAVRHVVRAAEDVFELQGHTLVPKGQLTNPGDPLEPLTPRVWLEGLAREEPYLFAPATRPH
jgi:hypothetical protein